MQTKFSPQQIISNECMKGHCAPLSSPSKFRKDGFTLIEVVLALGVVAFAFVALFGMLPVGLNAFNNSIDSTVETQIAQSVMSQLRQAKFSTLYTQYNDILTGQNTSPAGAPSFFKQYSQPYPAPQTGFYYDDQGNFLGLQTVSSQLSTAAASKYIYYAAVQVYYDTWTITSGNSVTPPYGAQPSTPSGSVSTTYNPASPAPFATVVVTVSKLSSPNVARIYTGFINNNGI